MYLISLDIFTSILSVLPTDLFFFFFGSNVPYSCTVFLSDITYAVGLALKVAYYLSTL